MPRTVLITTAVLVVIAGALGFWLGQQRLTLDDATGVIEAVAARHVARHGGDMSACLGWLEPDGALLNVRCGDVLYTVDRRGEVREIGEGGI